MSVTKISRKGRSRIMAAIRSTNTKPELRVRRFLHARGLRYTLHRRSLPGSPDLVFPAMHAVVFVHGCFWHCCPHCATGQRVVRSNIDYWHPKLKRNVERDSRARQELVRNGWKVFTIWECQTNDARVLARIAKTLLVRRAATHAAASKPYLKTRQRAAKP